MGCGCGNSSGSGCGCGGSSTCQCANIGVVSGEPFYNCGQPIQEAHAKAVTVKLFVTALPSVNDFVTPAVNATAQVTFDGLEIIQINTYLWSNDWGYLKVTGFDPVSGTVTVLNEGQAWNPAAGNLVRKGTWFNVFPHP